jgi:hypothetical protein
MHRRPTLLRLAALNLVAAIAIAGCATDLDVDGGGEGADALVAPPDAAEVALRENDDPDWLVVWTNNIENMLYDWKDLVHEMEVDERAPDLFLVQQLSGRDELDRLVAFMERRLGVDYTGVVAQDTPTHDRFGAQVLPRPKVTTGIVFRTARFEARTQDSWFPFGTGFDGQVQRCDVRTRNSGYETLRLRLHDRLADKDVVAVSLRHWTWHPCSTKNLQDIVDGNTVGDARDRHAGFGQRAALHLIGGDFNDRVDGKDGGLACWYRMMNRDVGAGDCATTRDLGFTDPLWNACDGDVACVKQRAGIDWLFARRSDGAPVRTRHFDIVSWGQAEEASVAATGGDGPSNTRARQGYDDVGDRYSGHRARRAWISYR